MNQKDLIIVCISIVVCLSIILGTAIFVITYEPTNEVQNNNITLNNTTINTVEEEYVPPTETKKEGYYPQEVYKNDPSHDFGMSNDLVQICPNCGIYTGTEGKYCRPCYDLLTGGAEYRGGFSLPDKGV